MLIRVLLFIAMILGFLALSVSAFMIGPFIGMYVSMLLLVAFAGLTPEILDWNW